MPEGTQVFRRAAAAVFALLLLVAQGVAPVAAVAPGNASFQATWARVDQPVAAGVVSRTWMWGPEAISEPKTEAYANSPDGQRVVQYFDKARMEITHPDGDPTADWYVTNGLLVVEMLSGQMQIGDNAFAPRQPAQINVAGDADDPSGPTYATFGPLRSAAPLPDGAAITQRVDRAGHVTDDPSLAAQGVTAAHRVTVPGIDHQVASPFWTFMHSSGTVYENGGYTTAALFSDPFYATGYPLTEAYWATVEVGGTPRDVLMQCFERRCLTYTPGNPDGFQTEAGNVGQHYYNWRYGDDSSVTQDQIPVVDVIGGNEIVVQIKGRNYKVRYIGVDAPLNDECYAAEATAANAALTLGKTVTLQGDVEDHDWYGVMERYVYVDGTFVNDALIRAGAARAIDTKHDINVAHKDELLAAQADAQANNRGLWGACE